MQRKSRHNRCSHISCKSRQKFWWTIAVVWQIRFAMIWCIWIVNIILGCLVFNVDHFVQHATLGLITENMLSQSFNSPVTLFPQLLLFACPRANPQPILQTVEPIDNILHSLRLSVKEAINYSSTARLNDLLMWLQKWHWWPKRKKHKHTIHLHRDRHIGCPKTNLTPTVFCNYFYNQQELWGQHFYSSIITGNPLYCPVFVHESLVGRFRSQGIVPETGKFRLT